VNGGKAEGMLVEEEESWCCGDRNAAVGAGMLQAGERQAARATVRYTVQQSAQQAECATGRERQLTDGGTHTHTHAETDTHSTRAIGSAAHSRTQSERRLWWRARRGGRLGGVQCCCWEA
jgi:hypothetical protein